MSWLRALASWCLLAALMIANGALREIFLETAFTPLVAHQLSSFTASLIIVSAAWVVVPWIRATTPSDQVRLGLAWLIITIVFEFCFGHWIVGHPWSVLLADYDILAGRLWILVLLATASAPWLVGRLRQRRST